MMGKRVNLSDPSSHRAEPGPDYWPWRCLRCGSPVSAHHSALGNLLRWILRVPR